MWARDQLILNDYFSYVFVFCVAMLESYSDRLNEEIKTFSEKHTEKLYKTEFKYLIDQDISVCGILGDRKDLVESSLNKNQYKINTPLNATERKTR